MRHFLLRSTRIFFAPDPGGNPGGGGNPDPAAGAGSFGALEGPVQQLVTAKGWKVPVDVINGYSELEKLQGGMVKIPGADAKPEEHAAFYAKLGVPASADKYDLSGFKAPDGVPWDGDAQKAIVAELHKEGMTGKQVTAALTHYGTYAKALATARDATATKVAGEVKPQLQKKWGDKFDANYALANQAVAAAFGTNLEAAKQIRLEDGTYLLDYPGMAEMAAQAGGQISEDGGLIGRGAPVAAGLEAFNTPEKAQAEITRIRSEAGRDRKHPYVNAQDPGHAEIQKKMLALHNIAAGNATVQD